MMKRLGIISFVLVGLLTVSIPLFAHHGNAAYDTTKWITVQGTVTNYIWANPHVFVKLDGKDDSGNTLHWIVESQNPVSMSQIGWTKDTFKRGDEVEVEAMQPKTAKPAASLGSASPS